MIVYMEKIRINKENDPVELTRAQVSSLFGCTSQQLKNFDNGKIYCLSSCEGGDRGSFYLESDSGNCVQLITLGDDQIEQYIKFEDDNQEPEKRHMRIYDQYADVGIHPVNDFLVG